MTAIGERVCPDAVRNERRWTPAAMLLLVGALAQVLVPLLGVERIGQVADANAHRITPAGYAFSIWTPIFVLAIGWAAWRLWPGATHSVAARRTDRWLAGAFMANALWEWVFPEEWFIPAQVIIVIGLVCGAGAFGILAFAREELTTVERWVLAPLSGLFLGWITAATLVGLLSTLVAFDVVGATTSANAQLGVLLLVTGLKIASSMTMIGSNGVPQLWIANVLAFGWALVAIVVGQFDESRPTAITAAIALVLLITFAAWRATQVRAAVKPDTAG
ncbi:MAG TPA: hypothetical protein VGT61_06980 [Thermomicrobiales bacterium]|jgi:hypothetical protein|nr:hypothetical protein [Thermomicrobiales bacterium]